MRKILVVCILLLLILLFCLSSVSATNVMWLKFDESSGNIASDSSGNGNGGILHGGNFTAGKIGNAIHLNQGNLVVVADSPSLSIANGFTAEAWVRATTSGTDTRWIFSKGYPNTANQEGFMIQLWGDDQCYNYVAVNNLFYNAIAAYPFPLDNQFHHIAQTVEQSGSNVINRGYLDGNLVSEKIVSGTITDTSIGMAIGGNNFVGEIDEAKIYDTALSASEIYNHAHPQDLSANLDESSNWPLSCWSFSDSHQNLACGSTLANDYSTKIAGSYSLKFTGARDREIKYNISLPVKTNTKYKVNVSLKIANRVTYNYLDLNYPVAYTQQNANVADFVDATKGIWSGRYFFNVGGTNMLQPQINDGIYVSNSNINWFNETTYIDTKNNAYLNLELILQGFDGIMYIDSINVVEVESHIDDKYLSIPITYNYQGMSITQALSNPMYVSTNAAKFSFSGDKLIMERLGSSVATLTFPTSFLTGLSLSQSTGFVSVSNSNVAFSIGADSSVIVKLKQPAVVQVESTVAGYSSGYHAFEAGIIFATDYTKGILFSPLYSKQAIRNMPYTWYWQTRQATYSDSDFATQGTKIWNVANDFSASPWKIQYTFAKGDGFLAEVFPPKNFDMNKYCKERLDIQQFVNISDPQSNFSYAIQKFKEHGNIMLIWIDKYASSVSISSPDYYYQDASGNPVSPTSGGTPVQLTAKIDVLGPLSVPSATAKNSFHLLVNQAHQANMKVIVYMSPDFYYTSDVDAFLQNMMSLINEFNLDGIYFDGAGSNMPLYSLELVRKARNLLGNKFYMQHNSWTYSVISWSNHFRVPIFDAYADQLWIGEYSKLADDSTWRTNYCGANVSNTVSMVTSELRPVNNALAKDQSAALSLSAQQQIAKSLACNGLFGASTVFEQSALTDAYYPNAVYYDSEDYWSLYDAACISRTCGDGVCDPDETIISCGADCALTNTAYSFTSGGGVHSSNSGLSVAQWIIDNKPFYKLHMTFDNGIASDDSGNRQNPPGWTGMARHNAPQRVYDQGRSVFRFNSLTELPGLADKNLNISNKNFSLFMTFRRADMAQTVQTLLTFIQPVSGKGFGLGLDSNSIFIANVANTSGQFNLYYATSAIGNATYHNVGIIYRSPKLEMYVDGVKEYETTMSILKDFSYANYNFGPFNGYIDDFFITDFALTPEQVADYDNTMLRTIHAQASSVRCIVTSNGAYYSAIQGTNPADLNGDTFVNLQDLIIVVSNLGTNPSNANADTNLDGIVDIFDVVYVASRFT